MASQPNSCTHIEQMASSLSPPRVSQQVHREECTLCFDGQDDPEGVLVCIQCFNGGCFAEGRRHAYLHYEKSRHSVGLVVKRTRKEQKKRDSLEPPPKKLAIAAPPKDEELYSYATHLICFACSSVGQPISSDDPKVTETVSGIMTAMSSAQQSEVKAWEEEILACEHTLTLEQTPFINPEDPLPTQCTECELCANLWLCLVCGLAHCGRKQFGGADGNSHALRHQQETGHAVAVKLGTITPEGTADVYCYACDDSKLDPQLPDHLGALGMKVEGMSKTEKTMTELNIDHNLKFDFSMKGDNGKDLEPIFGEGLTGLQNLGNSCYMASVLQTLFALPAFRSRYFTDQSFAHQQTCDKELPADCLECQMIKISDGLISGRYSHLARAPPVSNNSLQPPEPPKFQEGIRPAQFKSLIGKGHEEFSTMRQQDSEEFLQHLLDRIRAENKRQGRELSCEPTEILRFAMENRLQCTKCLRVGYKSEVVDLASLPVAAVGLGEDAEGKKLWERQELDKSIATLCADEELDDYACPHCGEKTKAIKSTKFKTFPDVLVLHMKKFQLINWVPTKLQIPIEVPEQLELDGFVGTGRQAGEEELDLDAEKASGPDIDPVAVATLESMGMPTIRCQRALLATGNNGAEVAMNWLFEHLDDPDIDEPLVAPAAAASSGPSDEQIVMISSMGFTPNQARKALRESDGNPERAIEWLFSNPDDPGEDVITSILGSNTDTPLPGRAGTDLPAKYRLKAFISHKGPSVHSGHYVATIRHPQLGLSPPIDRPEEDDDEWVLFNDAKVVRAPPRGGEEMRELAYLYVYERV